VLKRVENGSKSLILIYITVFQGGDDGRGCRNMCKTPGGSGMNLSQLCAVPMPYVPPVLCCRSRNKKQFKGPWNKGKSAGLF
jgi:hypothetical protein